MNNKKEPIKIRFKELKNGNKSIYFDIYQGGKRSYKFLGLYLLPDGAPLAKERNKTTLMQAETERARLVIQMQNVRFGAVHDGLKMHLTLAAYCEEIAKRYTKHSTITNYRQLGRNIKAFQDIRLTNINANYIRRFIAYLYEKDNVKGKPYKPNTIQRIYGDLRAVVACAKRDGYIMHNPCDELANEEKPKREDATREYLTISEVAKVAQYEPQTPRENAVKHAFMFGCYTGLRISDISTLKWGNIHTDENGQKYISITMVKTKKAVTIPLNENAQKWLPKKKPHGENGIVFYGIQHGNKQDNAIVLKMARVCGINKHITFHCARHTFATNLITSGADLYVVSKLLGHSDIQVTQIYAKVAEEKKRDAVCMLDAAAADARQNYAHTRENAPNVADVMRYAFEQGIATIKAAQIYDEYVRGAFADGRTIYEILDDAKS